MKKEAIDALLTPEYLQQVFPKTKADDFFEALLGDAEEGSYDISLSYRGCNDTSIHLEVQLKERPGHCLACNLTQGLPTVFSRHPIINIKGLVEQVSSDLGDDIDCRDWSLGYTQQKSSGLHAIPLTISLAS
ncbi:MAG: pancreas/duodenum homeobox protein 1 [Desulfopila sp.]